ncbi:MAG: phage head-tail connector protein [Faecalibacillus faecis]|uniref:phage head-tail connector protein n=1 Tax=Faecalibacillus faecis TaxID=1982628 RepID=UPI003991848C
MAIIDDVTVLLGFPEEKPNRTLDVIIRLTTNRLKTLLDVEEVPTELEYIVTEVSIVRYNKIGSEGVTSHSVEGETMSFSDNDFKGYLNDIEVWKNKKNEVKGVVKFL